jgi:hypothetical protein
MASHPLVPLLLDIVQTIHVLEGELVTYGDRELARFLRTAINTHPPRVIRELYRLEWMIKTLREGVERARAEAHILPEEDSE